MNSTTWRTLCATAGVFTLLAAEPVIFAYPATPVHPVMDSYVGKTVSDPCRWLEDPASPETRAWARKQSTLTLAYLHAQATSKDLRGACCGAFGSVD